MVLGGGHGIGARNYGTGDLTIDVNGWVGGYSSEDGGDGIHAFQAYNSEDGGALTITTGVGSTVRGFDDGIQADSEGAGALTIAVGGNVTGRYGAGINVHNGYGATFDEESEDFKSLTITTGAGSNVTGDGYGIFATNQGFGTFTISADGDVTGRHASGIFGIQNGAGMMTIMTGADSDVLGGKDGIDALNFGNGALFINVAGRVTGQGLTTTKTLTAMVSMPPISAEP